MWKLRTNAFLAFAPLDQLHISVCLGAKMKLLPRINITRVFAAASSPHEQCDGGHAGIVLGGVVASAYQPRWVVEDIVADGRQLTAASPKGGNTGNKPSVRLKQPSSWICCRPCFIVDVDDVMPASYSTHSAFVFEYLNA